MNLKGWAGYPKLKTSFILPDKVAEIQSRISDKNIIARGNGRSYGDAAIGATSTVSMKSLIK